MVVVGCAFTGNALVVFPRPRAFNWFRPDAAASANGMIGLDRKLPASGGSEMDVECCLAFDDACSRAMPGASAATCVAGPPLSHAAAAAAAVTVANSDATSLLTVRCLCLRHRLLGPKKGGADRQLQGWFYFTLADYSVVHWYPCFFRMTHF